MATSLLEALSFRARLVVAVTVITLATLGAAFAVISVLVTSTQEEHLDHALLRAAHDELAGIARSGPGVPAISNTPGPLVKDVGILTKYGAIYESGGTVRAASPTFGPEPPSLTALGRRPLARCFDFWFRNEHLRGALMPIPSHQGMTLLMATPRTELDGDARFLRRAMELVFLVAVGWAVGVATWMVRRLTRHQRRIAEVVRQVAGGDLSARIGPLVASGDEARLVRDIDDMIERLSDLFSAQRVFIAHAAHELRSPLTVLYGELALALRRSRDAEEYRLAIQQAFESTRQLKGLAEDLLAVARLGATPPPSAEVIDLREALEEARTIVLGGEPPPAVEVTIVGTCRPALAGARDVVRLFRNLLENAARHSPPGGRVTAALADSGRTLVVNISDEGPGIPETERGQIFTPFYRGTTVPTAAGAESGLGLTIARGIARAYGGDVVLDGEAVRGATFRVTLPAADDPVG